MPDIGFIELLIVGIVAFLVLGPERLPEFFSQIAKVVQHGRKWLSDLKIQFEQEKKPLIEPIEHMKQDFMQPMAQIKQDLNTTIAEQSNGTENKSKAP